MDGDIHMSKMFIGTDYNIEMDRLISGVPGGSTSGTPSFGVASSLLSIVLANGANPTPGTYTTAFIPTMYFYPGTKIVGDLNCGSKPSRRSNSTKFKSLEYSFKDLVSNDRLIVRVRTNEVDDNTIGRFQLLTRRGEDLADDLLNDDTNERNQITGDVVTLQGNEALDVRFELRYQDGGTTRLYLVEYQSDRKPVYTEYWRGVLPFNLSECTVELIARNGLQTTSTTTYSSDYIFVRYPYIRYTFDPPGPNSFIGSVYLFDTQGHDAPSEWKRVLSRDAPISGDRVIDNGIVRAKIFTTNPKIELEGWNYSTDTPTWDRICDITPVSDEGVLSNKVQNIVFDNFARTQLKCKINFGSTIWYLTMSRGCPWINILEKKSRHIRILTYKERLGGDTTENIKYNKSRTYAEGEPDGDTTDIIRGPAVVNNVPTRTMKDNYWGWYNPNNKDQMAGWLANLIHCKQISVSKAGGYLQLDYESPITQNFFGIGGLITDTSTGVAKLFNNNQGDDFSVKFRANESLWQFKQRNYIKRRNVG